MKKNKKIGIGIAVVISLLILLPFFIPIRSYLNQAESMATQQLGVPVQIGNGRLSLLPTPRVILKDVSVGNQQDLQISSIAAIPSLGSLFDATKIVDIHIQEITLKKSALELASALSAKKSENSQEVSPVHIRQIRVDALQLNWPDMKLPSLQLALNLNASHALDSAQIETQDSKVIIDIAPEGKAHRIALRADTFTLPADLPLLVNKASIDMLLKEKMLDVSNVDIDMYQGKINGNIKLMWDKNWRMQGQMKVVQLALQQPSRMISPKVYLSGALQSQGNFSASANDAAKLADNLRADFKFSVTNGVLHGLDLVKIAGLLTKQTSGGQTQFDEFNGAIHVTGKQYHLRDLKIRSGLLAGAGQVKVMPNQTLDGTAEVELKNSASLVAIPLDISGTVNDPVVLPSKAALAGAVAGTAVLGPGLGTSLGMKAGTAVEKFKGLFGGD